MKLTSERKFSGHPVSPGIGIGPLHEATEPALVISHKKIAALMDVYLHMLGPSRLMRGVRARVQDGLIGAEAAVQSEVEAQVEAILALTGSDRAGRLRRAEEVREIGRRVLRNLTRQPFRSFAGLEQGSILAANELRPADAALIQPTLFCGIVTEEGGADGHTAVMLRALGLPAVLGATGMAHTMQPGDIAVVDGIAGSVTLNPSAPALAAARKAVTAFARERQRYARLRRLPAVTLDGVPVELQ